MNITNFLFSAYSPENVILCIYRLQKPYISYLLIWARHIPIHFSEKDLHPNMHPFESSFLVDDIMAKTLCYLLTASIFLYAFSLMRNDFLSHENDNTKQSCKSFLENTTFFSHFVSYVTNSEQNTELVIQFY